MRQVIKRSNQDKRSAGSRKGLSGSSKSGKHKVSTARGKKLNSQFYVKQLHMLSDSSSTGEGEDGDAADEVALSLCASASHSQQDADGQFDQCLDMLQDRIATEECIPLSQPVEEKEISAK